MKETEELCRRSLVRKNARTDVTARVFRPYSGLKVNTRVFQEISMCAIFFSIMLPFLGKAFKAFKSLNRLT